MQDVHDEQDFIRVCPAYSLITAEMQWQHIPSTMYEIIANFAPNARGFSAFCFVVMWRCCRLDLCQTCLVYCS